MSHISGDTSGTQTGTSVPPEKRHRHKRPLSVSPEKRQEGLQNLPGGSCIKCDQALGPDSKAVQCDLCGAWIHSKCEGVSDEVYDKMNAVLGSLNNLVYYCETNNCTSRIKQLLYTCFTGETQSTEHEEYLTKQIDSLTEKVADLSQNCVPKQFDDLSKKIDDLVNKQLSLESSLQTMSSQFIEPATNMETDGPSQSSNQSPSNALDVADEMSDRERRKFNLVVYNFLEGTDRKADIKAFHTLSMDVFKLDLSILKAARLGPKNTNKHRPLLLTVEELDDKNYLISHSHFLRHHEQYKTVFIVPDRTKLERMKHKKAVDELRQRRTKGETGLIIRNGIVMKRQPRSNVPNSHQSVSSSHNSDQSSDQSPKQSS